MKMYKIYEDIQKYVQIRKFIFMLEKQINNEAITQSFCLTAKESFDRVAFLLGIKDDKILKLRELEKNFSHFKKYDAFEIFVSRVNGKSIEELCSDYGISARTLLRRCERLDKKYKGYIYNGEK